MAHPPTTPADAARSQPAEPVTSEPQAKPATHDTAPPPALLDFMVREWKPASARMPPRLRHAAAFAARRRALSKLFPGETLIVPTGHEKVRANDTYYRFRPGTDFYYLTGNLEPDCVLLMAPESGGGHRDVLFVEPNPGKSDSTFFTDRIKGELWVGPRLGVPQSQARFDVHEARPSPSYPDPGRAEGTGNAGGTRAPGDEPGGGLGAGGDPARQGAGDGALRDAPPQGRTGGARALGGHRLHQARLRGRDRAAAHRRHEREVEGIFNLRARVEGNDIGYNTIAAAGEHACILHWMKNEGDVRARRPPAPRRRRRGHSLYTADITRTLPVSGRFSREQRQVYELVHARRRRRSTQVRPGATSSSQPRGDEGARRGLERLGILEDAAEALATRTSSTSATRSTTSATCSASTCTTAPRRGRDLQVRQAQARHGPHRRARPLLPDRRPHRARAITVASACASRTTSWSPRRECGTCPPTSRARRRTSRLDGEGVEIARQADPRLTLDAGRRYRPRANEEVHFPDAG
jgi:Xaa-Pro aminopeptidase